ncbi:MAG: sugar phosphate isomerase/epimerase [Lentisphaeria bacterium]|nr:sugar phosphate isomerase/epimerase [Lentisphaeria bacterium]
MRKFTVTHLLDLWHVSNESYSFILDEFAANGATNIVLSDEHIIRIIRDPGMRKFYKETTKDSGLSFVDAHAPFGNLINLNCPVPELHREKILRALLALEITAEFGVDTITFHVGNLKIPGYTLEELHAETLRSLEEILPDAERLGVTICIENSWNPACTAERLLDIKEHFPTPALGFCYDSGHANLIGSEKAVTDPESAAAKAWALAGRKPVRDEQVLEKMLPHIVNCHLHDNDGLEDSHLIPLRGTIDWKKLMGTLGKAPRLKYIQNESIEVFRPGEGRRTSMRETMENMEKILQMLP